MTLSDGQRGVAMKRLRVVELWLAVIDGRRTIATMIGEADSESAALAAVTTALSCDEADAAQVLGLQLRRFTEVSRTGLSDERVQCVAELEGTDEEAASPSEVSIPPGSRLAFRDGLSVESPPLWDDEGAERRRNHTNDRVQILAALEQVGKGPTPVLELVYHSTDDEAARARLTSQFGWNRSQALAVLDMQLRTLSTWYQQRIKTEVQGVV